MEWLDIAFLGIVQGITEFLPVSSDGHIAIFALLFGVPDMSLGMVLVLHVGTLLATLLVFRDEIAKVTRATLSRLGRPKELLENQDSRLAIGVVIASVPTAIIGLLLEKRVEAWATVPWIVGVCLLVTAAMLVSTRWSNGNTAPEGGTRLGVPSYLIIGVLQGIAVLPGVSRSGSTIAAAMLLGMSAPEAFRFSFLLSLPAVAGAVVLKLSEPGALASAGMRGLLGGTIAFFVGLGALLALRKVVAQGRFWAFALYLVPLGLVLIALDLLT